ncbi:hypothetical protein BH11PLA2_BH11PLA2_07140 [soil metagenome]
MADPTIAHRAAALPWLAPATPLLAALATEAVAPWGSDPASVLLLLRYSRPTPTADAVSLTHFNQSSILESAAVFLEANADGWIDPTHPQIVSILNYSRRVAEHAESLAAVTGTCNPVAARVAGLLSTIGVLAIATLEPNLVEACRENADHLANPAATEQLYWGLTGEAITRRLASCWRLPAWVANTISTLRLPMTDAIKLGADAEISRVVRHAVAAAERPGEQFALLGRTERLLENDTPPQTYTPLETVLGITAETDPRTISLLPSLLKSVAKSRRSSGQNRVQTLETQVDSLQSTLTAVRQEFDTALRDAKLVSLAEFAAGAGHEINNPLTVISGNAQMLRNREEDANRRHTLDVIIRQTGRVSELLHDVMQFARPATPRHTVVRCGEILEQVGREHEAIAKLKQVELRVDSESNLQLFADGGQVRKALGNLIRNAIEHTPTAGRIQVLARLRHDTVELIVEDSGPGPDPESIPHLFDPFFSGRSAGRGRGLGLATAWRFAQENNGTLRFERTANGPTKFILSLPWSAGDIRERMSA